MNNEIIIGNICSVGATLCDSYSGTRKDKKSILLVQCFSQLFYIAASLALKAYSSTVQNIVAIFRNIFAAFDIKNKFLEITFVLLPVALGLIFNNRGLMGTIPVVANLEYSISMFVFKNDPKKLKIAFVLNTTLYFIFNIYLLNIMGGIFNFVTLATTIIALCKNKK